MKCPIEQCPLEATGLGLCAGHFSLAPVPVKSEIYQLVRRHRNGPSHQKAIRRACIYVNEKLASWEKDRVRVSAP